MSTATSSFVSVPPLHPSKTCIRPAVILMTPLWDLRNQHDRIIDRLFVLGDLYTGLMLAITHQNANFIAIKWSGTIDLISPLQNGSRWSCIIIQPEVACLFIQALLHNPLWKAVAFHVLVGNWVLDDSTSSKAKMLTYTRKIRSAPPPVSSPNPLRSLSLLM